jgi:hypothetical protein
MSEGEVETESLRRALLATSGDEKNVEEGDHNSDTATVEEKSEIATGGKVNPTEECAICFDELSSGELMALPCGHVFHTTCVSNWLARHPFCPHCRINVLSLRPDDDDDDDNDNHNRRLIDDADVVSRHWSANSSVGGDVSNASSAVFFVDENVRNDVAGGAAAPGTNCHVCGQAMVDGDVHLFTLACAHRFHRECLGASLLRAPRCPQCYAPVQAAHRVNDPRDVLLEDNDIVRLAGNRVRLQAWSVRRSALFYERKRRWGCMLLLLLVLLAAGMALFLWASGRLTSID